ncbi:MAG TPA: penicillin-binding protein [Chitinophagaceae bacterium]
MDVKKDILWRVYLCFIVMVLVCIVIFGKAFYIQQVEGKHWRSMGDTLHLRWEEVEAERGTIFSEDGQMLSTSIPQFDIYIDFGAEGLREKSGRRFRTNLDSLSSGLAALFKDRSASEYKRFLWKSYRAKNNRYVLLKKKISYRDYQKMLKLPLVREGRNKSGFIAEVRSIRLNPYQLLAYRTIGLDRENAQKIGLEQTYDSVLKGTSGQRLMRYVAGGVTMPVEDEENTIEPRDGKDIITTLDMHIQEITENALMKMMVGNEAEYGCAIVMEVETGKVKAIANLGRRANGTYFEDYNYALTPSEPGSTFKLATLIAVLEDGKATINTAVNLEGGSWQIAGRTVFDSEQHGLNNVDIKRAFEVSSNVGMAKLAVNSYGNAPSQFISHLKQLKLDRTTGVDLVGERKPVIYKPGSRHWSNTTLPWMAFGYNLMVTPMHTAMLYNAVANKGKMMKPYLVNSIVENGRVVRDVRPEVVNEQICTNATLKQLQACLEGVTTVPGGTGYQLFRNSPYRVAGKTGTALVANGSRGYSDHIYQSSFAGYFPAENPQYTIVVVIKNKPHAAKFYGASVAGPVFREISDRLYTLYVKQEGLLKITAQRDSARFEYAGASADVKEIFSRLQLNYADQPGESELVMVSGSQVKPVITAVNLKRETVPSLRGLTLKDAVSICENIGLKVAVQGKGRVVSQSLEPGSNPVKGKFITIRLEQ